MKLSNLTKIFKKKSKDGDEFSLTFKMPRSVFKDMLPIIERTRSFPINFDWREIQNLIQGFMVDQKNEVTVNYGEVI